MVRPNGVESREAGLSELIVHESIREDRAAARAWRDGGRSLPSASPGRGDRTISMVETTAQAESGDRRRARDHPQRKSGHIVIS